MPPACQRALTNDVVSNRNSESIEHAKRGLLVATGLRRVGSLKAFRINLWTRGAGRIIMRLRISQDSPRDCALGQDAKRLTFGII
jgi:hypothetical protein